MRIQFCLALCTVGRLRPDTRPKKKWQLRSTSVHNSIQSGCFFRQPLSLTFGVCFQCGSCQVRVSHSQMDSSEKSSPPGTKESSHVRAPIASNENTAPCSVTVHTNNCFSSFCWALILAWIRRQTDNQKVPLHKARDHLSTRYDSHERTKKQ